MERLIDAIANALDDACLTREELAAAVRKKVGASTAKRLGSGWGEFLKPAARRGVLCSGPPRGQSVTFVRPDQWLAAWSEPPEREQARAELIRRFLRVYGPASKNDFARWLGSARAVREPWEIVGDEIAEVEPSVFVLAADAATLRRPRKGGVQLLPGFDPYLLFPYSARPVEPEHKDRVYRQAGWISATVIHDGRAVATWDSRRRGGAVELTVRPFAGLARKTRDAVDAEARRLARYLGGELNLRFA
jgi:hypothetical protein